MSSISDSNISEPEDSNNIDKRTGNYSKKLIKRGFVNYKIRKYSKDNPSHSRGTNISRWKRLLFIAHQLERDSGVQLLIYGYFPNESVGSCGGWSLGKTTKLLAKKSETINFYKYWENVFATMEDQRQKKETIDIEKCLEAANLNTRPVVNMLKKGLVNCKVKKLKRVRDNSSNIRSTHNSRWDRLLFIAHQLERDTGAQLLIFGYFPNKTVGSCGGWAIGKTTNLLREKPETQHFSKYWEKVFTLIEDQRQKKEIIEVEKCHQGATLNTLAVANMDWVGDSDMENETEFVEMDEPEEDETLRETNEPNGSVETSECDILGETNESNVTVETFGSETLQLTDKENVSMETCGDVELLNLELQRWLDSARITNVQEIILTIDSNSFTVSLSDPAAARAAETTTDPSAMQVVPAAGSVGTNKRPWSQFKKMTTNNVLASSAAESRSCDTEQPTIKKSTCNADICLKPKMACVVLLCARESCSRWFHPKCLGFKPKEITSRTVFLCNQCPTK